MGFHSTLSDGRRKQGHSRQKVFWERMWARLGKIGWSRWLSVVIRNVAGAAPGALFPHDAGHCLVIYPRVRGAQLRGDAPVAIARKLRAQLGNLLLHRGSRRTAWAVIGGPPRQFREWASLRDGDGLGPLTME